MKMGQIFCKLYLYFIRRSCLQREPHHSNKEISTSQDEKKRFSASNAVASQGKLPPRKVKWFNKRKKVHLHESQEQLSPAARNKHDEAYKG